MVLVSVRKDMDGLMEMILNASPVMRLFQDVELVILQILFHIVKAAYPKWIWLEMMKLVVSQN